MDLDDYLASIRRDGERIRELSAGDLSADVPSCAGWLLGDLVEHVARVFTLVNEVLGANATPDRLPDLPEGGDVATLYGDAFRRLLDNLTTTNPSEERWNWSVGPQTAAFWWRRMAHETAVHRWDAENALGSGSPIGAELAADGIDEWFDVHLRSDITEPDIVGDVAGTFHVHCTDTEGEWWASLADRALVLERTHKKGDVAIRGNASDLVLVLWGRLPPTSVDVVGDASVLTSWLAVPAI